MEAKSICDNCIKDCLWRAPTGGGDPPMDCHDFEGKPESNKASEENTASMENDYRQRMADEYAALKDKYNKLHKMLIKHDAGTLGFELNCPVALLRRQAAAMGEYLYVLEVRAEIEDVSI